MSIGPRARRLEVGEKVKAGDIMVYGPNHQFTLVVRKCKYDPGCCVGHEIWPNDAIYYREEEDECRSR